MKREREGGGIENVFLGDVGRGIKRFFFFKFSWDPFIFFYFCLVSNFGFSKNWMTISVYSK